MPRAERIRATAHPAGPRPGIWTARVRIIPYIHRARSATSKVPTRRRQDKTHLSLVRIDS
eukprot:88899-Pyramimonas_sp.AAC.1